MQVTTQNPVDIGLGKNSSTFTVRIIGVDLAGGTIQFAVEDPSGQLTARVGVWPMDATTLANIKAGLQAQVAVVLGQPIATVTL